MTPTEAQGLMNPNRQKGILLDTNLLLLLWVGRWNPKMIAHHKRTVQFDQSDFEMLERFVATFQRVVVTPSILTESTNLIRQHRNRRDISATLIEQITPLDERFRPSVEVIGETAFVPLGLTDAGIITQARDGWLVLTVDFDLVNALNAEGLNVLNFFHLISQTDDS